MTGTQRSVVAEQARAIADAWSPPDAPESWWLTAATFAAIAEEEVLLDLAAAIPPDRLPPLLLGQRWDSSPPAVTWPATTRIPVARSRRGIPLSGPRSPLSPATVIPISRSCARHTATR